MTAPALTVFYTGQGTVNGDQLNTFEQTCDTLAQVRSFSGIVGSSLFVRSTDGSVTGGAGTFYWNTTSVAADDSGLTTIQPTGSTSAGRWLRVNMSLATMFNANFSTPAVGSLFYQGLGQTLASLPPGSLGQVLTLATSGASLVPAWAASVTGITSLTAGTGLSTTTAGGSGGIVTTTGSLFYDPTQVGWGWRNRLINSGMVVSQWNGASAVTLGTFSAFTNFTVDRWFGWLTTSGTGITAQQTSVQSGGVNYVLQIQRASSSTTTSTTNLSQVLETNNVVDLQGKTVTLQFRAQAGGTFSGASGQINAAVITGNGANQSSASFVAGTWTSQTTIGTLAPSLTTSVQFFTLTVTIPAGATQLGVQFSWAWTGTAGANDYVRITDVEVVPGTWTAPQVVPERPPIWQQLAMCQRYYWQWIPAATTTYVGSGVVTSSTNAFVTIPLPQAMRIVPSAVFSTATNFRITTASNYTASAVALNTSSTPSVAALTVTSSGMSSGQGCVFGDAATLSATIGFIAEL